MFGGGGVSYAAEGAVPGDALYPIKVGINEEVRDIVALTPEAKADWESRLVERRLEEAEKLAEATGAIPPAAQEIIEEKLEKHIEKLEIHLSRVEEKKNVEQVFLFYDGHRCTALKSGVLMIQRDGNRWIAYRGENDDLFSFGNLRGAEAKNAYLQLDSSQS